mmetsp:Transcript_19079/g.59934  ORF Transcript_19079/g.59934 Transcript_19079/m.59934 type:complete len:227 (+) Transcript_19079:283-963(+)
MFAACRARRIWMFDTHFQRSEMRTGDPDCGSIGGTPSPWPRRAALSRAFLIVLLVALNGSGPSPSGAAVGGAAERAKTLEKISSTSPGPLSPGLVLSFFGSVIFISPHPSVPLMQSRPSPFRSSTMAPSISRKSRLRGGSRELLTTWAANAVLAIPSPDRGTWDSCSATAASCGCCEKTSEILSTGRHRRPTIALLGAAWRHRELLQIGGLRDRPSHPPNTCAKMA